MDGMGGNGLKLEKIGQVFQVLILRVPISSRNLLWIAISDKNSFDIFVVALQKHSVYD